MGSVKLSQLRFTELDIRQSIDECRIRGLDSNDQTGMVPAPTQLSAEIEKLRAVVDEMRKDNPTVVDFPVRYDGMVFRVSVIHDINGPVYSCRQIETGEVSTRNCGVHEKIRRTLLEQRSGLIIVSGPFRAGKTTLAAALVREWLETNGGKCVTLEDPPEALLSGPHGDSGICYQVMIDRGEIENQVEIHARSTYDLLFIGETRGGKMGAAATVASANGGLILTTYHSDNIVDTITRWLADTSNAMGMEEARTLLSRSLVAVLHMTTRPRKLPTMQSFLLVDHGEGIRARIKAGELTQLVSDVRTQRNRLLMGRFKTQEGDGT